MPYELRVPGDEDIADFMRPVWRGFGNPAPSDDEIAEERLIWEPERSLGALDGDEWVAGAGAFSLDLTLPGGATTPVAGVTMVGVASTHRRRGILRQLMERQLHDVVERGEVIAALTASETSIYGRFGYGWATSTAELEVACDRSWFRTPPDVPGRLRMLQTTEASEPVAAAYDRCARLRAGTVSRSEGYWKIQFNDAAHRRGGNSALFVVLHEDADGRPDGYATYRVRVVWSAALPDNTIIVQDLVGADAEVEAALWRFLLDIDLASRVRCSNRPVDDPIRWRLVEPRRLRTLHVIDYLWVRLLDVSAALELRSYGLADRLVLDVTDSFRPASGGRFSLDASPEGAECTSSEAEPDLAMGAEEIGSIYLGGVAPSALAAAGRVTECTPGALARADALFGTSPAPFNGTMF